MKFQTQSLAVYNKPAGSLLRFIPSGINKTGKIVDVFDYNFVGMYFDPVLGGKMLQNVAGFPDIHSCPLGDVIHCGLKFPFFRGFVNIGLGFIEHQKYIGNFCLGVVQDKGHKAPFGVVDPLAEHPQNPQGNLGIPQKQNLKISGVKFQDLYIVHSNSGGGTGGIFKNRHLAEHIRGPYDVQGFFKITDDLYQVDPAGLDYIKIIARFKFGKDYLPLFEGPGKALKGL
jgi:hypothetical protein